MVSTKFRFQRKTLRLRHSSCQSSLPYRPLGNPERWAWTLSGSRSFWRSSKKSRRLTAPKKSMILEMNFVRPKSCRRKRWNFFGVFSLSLYRYFYCFRGKKRQSLRLKEKCPGLKLHSGDPFPLANLDPIYVFSFYSSSGLSLPLVFVCHTYLDCVESNQG